MHSRARTIFLHYVGAVIFTALAVLVRWLLDPWLGDFLPFPTLYGAVALAVWSGGYRPALLATALGFLACDWLFVQPRGAFGLDNVRNLLGLGAYLSSCGIIIGFGEAMHSVRRRLECRQRELEQAVTQRLQAEKEQDRLVQDLQVERSRLEESLRSLAESERRYRIIGELIPYGVWILDGQGEIIHLSDSFLEMLGHTLEEHRKNWPSRIHPEDYERIVGGLPRWLQGTHAWEEEYRIRGKDSQYRTLLSCGVPLRDGNGQVACWVGINLDLTKRKQAQEEIVRLNRELRSRVAELQAILDVVPVGVGIAHDPLCRRITHNPYISELLGVPAWENASHSTGPGEAQTGYKVYRGGKELAPEQLPMQVACTGVEVRDFEVEIVRPDRPPIHLACFARPLRDQQGRVRGSVGATLDITARKQAEEALRQATEQLRIVTDSMAAPVTRCSRDLRYLWVSKPYADWIEQPANEIIGRPIVDIIGPEAFERLRPYFERVLAGEVVRYEEQVNFQGIGPRWISAVYTPTLGSGGEPDGWVAVVTDVTDRRRIEESLRQGEARFRHLAEAMPQIVWTAAPNGRITYINSQWTALTGLSLEETNDRDAVRAVIHPDDFEPVVQRWAEALAAGMVHEAQWRFRDRANGAYRWFLTRAVPVRDGTGAVCEWFGTATDIDDQKHAEEALGKREREFRALADNTPALVARFDRDLRHLFVNRQVEVATGLPASAYIGKSNRELGVPEDLYAAGDERLRTVFQTGQAATLEFTYPGSAGSRHFHSWFGPEVGPSGEVESALCITHDVTEQKALETELHRRMADLAEADRRKDEFLAILAHELRNPLAPLRNGLQIIRLAGNDRAAVEQARAMMERQLEHFVRLVDDLLDLSRISRDKIILHKERIDLATMVNSAVESCEPLIQQSGHELTVTLPDEPVYVDADKTRLAQVLCNLLTNAAKFSERGSRIWLAAERQGSEAVLSVKDTGVGIPPHMRAAFSRCLPRWIGRWRRRGVGWGSACPSSSGWSRCTAAAWRRAAREREWGVSSLSACPSCFR